jgi:hypothetical protein
MTTHNKKTLAVALLASASFVGFAAGLPPWLPLAGAALAGLVALVGPEATSDDD